VYQHETGHFDCSGVMRDHGDEEIHIRVSGGRWRHHVPVHLVHSGSERAGKIIALCPDICGTSVVGIMLGHDRLRTDRCRQEEAKQ
jgi:hypothetical protein